MSKIVQLLGLASIVTNAGTQFRESLCEEATNNYTEILKAWKEENTKDAPDKSMSEWTKCPLPAIVVFKTPENTYINADGFHRIKAAKAAKLEYYPAEQREGTKEDAIKYALQANDKHGVRLTDADKHNKLKAALKVDGYATLSNNALAAKIGVSESFVRTNRPASENSPVRSVTTKEGKTSSMDTSNIGKKTGSGRAKKAAAKKAAKKSGKKADKKSAATQPEGDQGAGGEHPSSAPPAAKQFDEETEANIKKICAAVFSAGLCESAEKLDEAIRTGVFQHISKGDIREWATTSAKRIAMIYPLVTENLRMKPKAAYAYIDAVPTSNTRLEHLFNVSLARREVLCEDVDGFVILIAPKETVKHIRNHTLGAHCVVPKGAEEEFKKALAESF